MSGEDFQYFQVTEARKTSRVQESGTGCYFCHKDFVYYYNHQSGIIQPLCNKANCLHDLENNPEKQCECNAHIDDLVNADDNVSCSFMLYQDHLYISYLNAGSGNEYNSRYTVCKMAQDGSSKELIFQTENGMNLSMIHRGYLYYIADNHEVSENGIQTRYFLARINVSKKNPKEEVLYASEGSLNGYGYLQAYGDEVCFELTEAGNESETCLGIMDIHSKTIRTIPLDGHPVKYRDAFYRVDYVFGEDDRYKTSVCQINPENGEQTEVIRDVPNGTLLQTDGEYLYRNNGWIHDSFPDEPLYYWVYDARMNLIDEFTVPSTEKNFLGPAIGGKYYQYEIFDDPDTGEWGLLVWDKSKIGSYHGTAYEQERIVYGGK